MAVELWNDKTRNAIAEFSNEGEAAAFVRETIALYGEPAVATWALDAADDQPMIRGKALLALAAAVPA